MQKYTFLQFCNFKVCVRLIKLRGHIVTYHSSIGLTSSRYELKGQSSPNLELNLCFRSLACICARIEVNGTKSVV